MFDRITMLSFSKSGFRRNVVFPRAVLIKETIISKNSILITKKSQKPKNRVNFNKRAGKFKY